MHTNFIDLALQRLIITNARFTFMIVLRVQDRAGLKSQNSNTSRAQQSIQTFLGHVNVRHLKKCQ